MTDLSNKIPMMADSSRTDTVTDFGDRNTLVTTVEDAADKELVDAVSNLDIQSMGISKDSDADEVSDDSSANFDQELGAVNPLIILVISSCLFDYFDVTCLKNARLVCKDWADAGAVMLIIKSTLLVDGDWRGNNWNSFTTIMGQTSNHCFQTYTFQNMNATRLESIFSSIGQQIVVFKLVDPNFTFKLEFLRSLLLECPNLEKCIIDCPEDDFTSALAKLFQPQDKKTFKLKKVILMAMAGIHPNILMELINACPHLQSLIAFSQTGGESDEVATTLLGLGVSEKIKLDKLDELHLGCVDRQTMGLLRRQKLSLSELQIYFMPDVDGDSVEVMLNHLSGTLKTFYCVHNQPTLTFALVFPENMTKLTTIKIEADNNGFLVAAIESALKLPNLDTLLLSGFSTNVCNIHCSHSLDFDTSWTLMELHAATARCLSLKTLQIPFGLTDGEIVNQIATLFPNVTDLRLHHPSGDVIASVFANYKNLERLSIKMHSFPPNVDSVLTGLKQKWCTTMLQKNKFKFKDPAEVTYKRPGLKDMKILKYFELREQVSSSNLTEVTLYHGLWYLTQAIQIDLQGCQQFTEGGIEELKSALGPCCFLNINHNEQEGDDRFWSHPRR